MPAPKSIPPKLHDALLIKAGEGLSGQQIADWLRVEHGVATSARAVQRHLKQVATDRAPIAQAVTQEKLSKTVTADLDAVDAILDRARKDELAAGRLDDVEARVEQIAKADIRDAYNEDGSLKAPKDLPDDVAHSISGIETETFCRDEGQVVTVTKVKFRDSLRALDLLAKSRATLSTREMALKARDQQLKALALRLELAGAGGALPDDLDARRARLLSKLSKAIGEPTT